MAVKYDVIFKDGQRLTREAVCFGSMAGGEWGFGSTALCNRDPSEQSLIQFYTANNIHPIWGEDDYMRTRRDWPSANSVGAGKQEANRKFLTEMKLLFADLPWLEDVITIHPVTGVVRAHIKKHAADKIITSLFLVRNLANYSETAATYRHFRSQGLRPRFCAIMACYMAKNFGAMGRCDFTQQYLGEYNWFNPQAFGKQSFLQMMQADKDTEFDFIQLPWAVQRGYRRDGFYRYRNNNYDVSGSAEVEDYDETVGGWKIFDSRYYSAERWDWERNEARNPRLPRTRGNSSHLYTRNVVDCYGISGDVPFDNVMRWNPVYGMTIFNCPGNSDRSSMDVANDLVSEMERICTEAGIPTRIEV